MKFPHNEFKGLSVCLVFLQNASKVVALLLSHRASTDLLWSGHSPLSLAIASGNDLVDLTHTHTHRLTLRHIHAHGPSVCPDHVSFSCPGSGRAVERRRRSQHPSGLSGGERPLRPRQHQLPLRWQQN